MLLCCQRDSFGEVDEIAYWSPADARLTEVDFVISRGSEIIAVEVKAGRRLRPEWLAGLKAIGPLPGLKRRLLVYLGRERPTKGPIEVLPFERFVRWLAEREL